MESKGFSHAGEIAAKLGFRSPNAAEDHLRALERKGAIRLLPVLARHTVLTEGPAGIPVVGPGVSRRRPPRRRESIESHCAVDCGHIQFAANFFSCGSD